MVYYFGWRRGCAPLNPISLVEVGVDYSCPLKKVKRITTEVAREGMEEVPGGVLSFRPLVRYHTFADSSVDFTVTLRAKDTDQDLIKRLHGRYEHRFGTRNAQSHLVS